MLRHARDYGVPPWVLAGIPETEGHECWLNWMNALAVAEGRYQQYLNQKREQAAKTRPR